MRRVVRPTLSKSAAAYLSKRENVVEKIKGLPEFSANSEWKKSRQTKSMDSVLDSLKTMMGKSQRCIYCHDSHGADIEHFWPKAKYPERMHSWSNLLLCCTECGRLKGEYFPLNHGTPLLIDPSTEEPWEYLDFDPVLGVIVPAYDIAKNSPSRKGEEMVKALQLDCREALQVVYLRTFKRLSRVVKSALAGEISEQEVFQALISEDDHGLIGWFIAGTGKNVEPFKDLWENKPEIWDSCKTAYFAEFA